MKKMCDMENNLNRKLNNIDKYRMECSSRISDYKFSDKRIKLLISTSIIIETAMLNAYEISRIYDTRAISKLYSDGNLNDEYEDITSKIKLVRNSLVHINVGLKGYIKELKVVLDDINSKTFKDYTKDLFGKYNIFTDREIETLHDMIAESIGIDLFEVNNRDAFRD